VKRLFILGFVFGGVVAVALFGAIIDATSGRRPALLPRRPLALA
jgi:hypothetical protein